MNMQVNTVEKVSQIAVSARSKWLQGIKHISCNTLGNVFWRGHHVSTVMNPYDEKNKVYLERLRDKCERLFKNNIPVNIATADHYFHWFEDISIDEPYKKLLARCPSIKTTERKIFLIFENSACEYDGNEWQYYILPTRGTRDWRKFCSGILNKDLDYEHLCSKSSLNTVKACFEKYNVPENILDLMSNSFNQKEL